MEGGNPVGKGYDAWHRRTDFCWRRADSVVCVDTQGV